MKWLSIFGALAFTTFLSAAGPFEIIEVPEEIPESNPVTRTRVLEDKTEFSFIAPEGWIATADSGARRIALQSRTNQLTFTIRLTTNAYPATVEKFKELVATNYTGISRLETYGASSGSGPGHGADLRHLAGGKVSMNTRLAVFTAPGGSAEVALSSPTTPIADLHHLWTAFLNSVRVEPRAPAKK